jgi:hypothetical protein
MPKNFRSRRADSSSSGEEEKGVETEGDESGNFKYESNN